MTLLKPLAALLLGAAAFHATAADTELNLYSARHYQTDEALYSNFTAKTGKIKFDAKGDAEGVGFSLYQVKNGTFAEVK